MTPEERAEKIVPNKCEILYTNYPTELREQIAAEIRAAVEEEGQRVIKLFQESLPASVEMARELGLEEAAKIAEGDVLLTPDEFEGKTKLKVFDLLERLAAAIRARAKELL